MAIDIDKNKREFWIEMMEKLNATHDLYAPIPELLRDLCELFMFGCGFIYQADYLKQFTLTESYVTYPNSHLHETLSLYKEIGVPLTRELANRSSVVFTGSTEKDELEQGLANLFGANSMILIPIMDHTQQIMGLVGVVDRRSDRTILTDDMEFAYAILSTLANHIKLTLYQVRVETTQKSLESILDNSGVDIYVNDFYTQEILYANRTMVTPYGGVENMVGKTCWGFLYNDKTDECEYCPKKYLIDEDGQPTKVYSWDYKRPFDGKWFRVMSAAFKWVDGRLANVNSSVDITESKRNEELIRQMAEYDPLTQLPNRRKLVVDSTQRITQLMESGQIGYVLFFDLDGFKNINDTLGHQAGDELLIQIGKYMQENPITRNSTYRYGGDEFVILFDELAPYTLDDLLEAIKVRFSQSWNLNEQAVECNCSIGVAVMPDDGTDIMQLLHKADNALYEAKRAGKGRVFFYNQGKMSEEKQYSMNMWDD